MSTAAEALPPRGGGDGSSSDAPEKKETYESLATKALASIRFCAKASLGSALMDVLGDFLGQLFPDAAAAEPAIQKVNLRSMVESVAVAEFLYRIGFGLGLFAVSKLYSRALASAKKTMSNKEIFDVSRIMSVLWAGGTGLLFVVVIVDAIVLREDIVNNPLAAKIVGPESIGALAVAGFAAVGFASSAAENEISKEHPLAKEDDKGEEVKAKQVRSMGFAAARNMALCMASVGTLGVMDFLIPILKPMEMVERVFGLLDVYEDVVYVLLLRTLNRCFLRAIAQATDGRQEPSESNSLLFDAQEKFYKKLGETFLFTSGLQLLYPLYQAGVAIWKMIMG